MMKILITTLLVVIFGQTGKCQFELPPLFEIKKPSEPKNMTVEERWQSLENKLKNTVDSGLKIILPTILKTSGKANFSSDCMKATMKLVDGIRNIRPWAMKFVDSSSKMIDGLMVGSMTSFGSFDECLDIVVTSEKVAEKGQEMFRGQYCSIQAKPHLPPLSKEYSTKFGSSDSVKNLTNGETIISELMSHGESFHAVAFHLGLCVPSSCTLNDINQLAILMGKSMSLNMEAIRCEKKEDVKFSNLHISVILVFCFGGMLMLIGSLIDIYIYYKKVNIKSIGLRIFLAFSLISNFKKFTDTNTASETLSCLNGIRFMTMTWIIIAHLYGLVDFTLLTDLLKAKEYTENFAFQAIMNATLAVDTFFCVGGLLVAYVLIRAVKLNGHNFSVTLYIIHRLFRLLPTYICVIHFVFLMDLLGSGPVFHRMVDRYIEPCEKNWWTNLLFVNNFYEPSNNCIPQSWYVSVDFQLYLCVLLILLPLIRWPKVGVALCILCVLGSIICTGFITYINDYPPILLRSYNEEAIRNYVAEFYNKPSIHAGPYCVGILSGYILATYPKIKMSRLIQVAGWIAAFVCNFSVLYGAVEWNRGATPTLWERLLYSSLCRTAWSLGVAWMIVCCSTGHGGVVNYILSWKAFVPLGRLTYTAFLLHTIVLTLGIGTFRIQIQNLHFFAVMCCLGFICYIYASAFATSMLVEAPFLNLEKMLLQRGHKKVDEPTTLKEDTNGSINMNVTKDTEQPSNVDVMHKL